MIYVYIYQGWAGTGTARVFGKARHGTARLFRRHGTEKHGTDGQGTTRHATAPYWPLLPIGPC